jgi:hypothetical protein
MDANPERWERLTETIRVLQDEKTNGLLEIDRLRRINGDLQNQLRLHAPMVAHDVITDGVAS